MLYHISGFQYANTPLLRRIIVEYVTIRMAVYSMMSHVMLLIFH